MNIPNMLDKANGSGWHVLVSGAMLASVVGLAFWVGTIAQQIVYLNQNMVTKQNVPLSSEGIARLTVLEINQKLVLERLQTFDERQTGIFKDINRLELEIDELQGPKANRRQQ